eukprot:42806_1
MSDTTNTYTSIRSFFSTILSIYYNDLEVAGRENIPSSGPTIIALNHANSLADTAVSMTSLAPTFVRYTCKDTLLSDPKFGWVIRGVKCIGIKRKQDYKDKKVDNKDAFNKLFNELANNCVVAMFPEGIGKYKSSLSPFRTGLARIAINFILQNPSKSINILPVGMTYLHREKFRSSVGVRIGEPIILNLDTLKQKKQSLIQNETKSNEDSELSLNSDEIYKIGQNITTELTNKISDLVISSPDWHMLCISHLARSIMFPESNSPRNGTFLTYYIDLSRQFNNVFRDNSDDKLVENCYSELNAYWKVLWLKGLKDYRIFELTNYKTNNISWMYKKCNIFMRLMYRTVSSVILCGVSLPGIISSMPIYFMWQWLRQKRIKKGIEGCYDGLAMNKMFMITFGVPTLSMIYSSGIWYKFGWKNGVKFGACYPLMLWLSVRAWQDGYSCLKSVLSLLKMFFMSSKKENVLIECRSNVYDLVSEIASKYNIRYRYEIMSDKDKKQAQLTKRLRMPWLQQKLTSRIKNDWNETIRLYDVPTDEFHLNNM